MISTMIGSSGRSSGVDASWTIMVYMANDSTSPLPSQDNINAMEAAQRASGTRILVMLDEPGDGNSRLLDIQHDTNLDQSQIISDTVDDNGEVIGSSGEVNTGNSTTLANFVKFSTSHWPADRYVLILWGHGAGWDGLCLDGIDILTLIELKEGLVDARSTLGRSLDMIAVDACVEATIETLYQMRSCADYFVAAQTNIPYQGLPYYQILTALEQDPGQNLATFGGAIVEEYIAWSAVNSQNSATLAVFDLTKVTAVTNALVGLSEQGLRYDSIFHSSIHTAMADSEYYDAEWTFDLGDFLVQLSASDVPLEMKTLAADAFLAYSKMVTRFDKFDHPDPFDGIRVTNASGAIIYAPSTSPFDVRYLDLDLAATNWDEFAKSARLVAQTNDSEPGPVINYSDTDSDGRMDQVTLVWSDAYPTVSVWVFRYSPHGMTHVRTYESDTSSVTVSGIAGELVVSASATVNGSAVSYSVLSITLHGTSTIEVQLLMDGTAVSEGYDVRVVSTNLADYAEVSNGKFYARLTVPTQAAVGQLVQIEVLNDDGQTVSTTHVFVPDTYTTLEIAIFPEDTRPQADFNVLLLFSILPGLFVLAFSIMLYVDFKKKQRTA